MDTSRVRIDSLTAQLLECYEELDLVHRLSRDLMSTLDAAKSAGLVLDEAHEIFEAELGCVIPAPGAHPAFPALRVNVNQDRVDTLCHAVLGDLFANGKSRILNNVAGEYGVPGEGLPRSVMCAVLRTETEVLGALCVGRNRDFTAGELKLANTLASQAAISIENSRLHEQRLEEQQQVIRLQEELRLAREIQTRLLPSQVPEIHGYDLAGRSIPAQSVGGDYFDLIRADNGCLAVCLGDVSGKGLPAAILMSNLQASIRGQTLMQASPRDCLSRSNRLLYQSTAIEKFATCFYGILDPVEHRLCYSNAGHDHPILQNGETPHRTLERGGLVLGIMEDVAFDEESIAIEPGSTLLIYSDGIIDAVNARDEEFGIDRLLTSFRSYGGIPAEEIVDRLMTEVNDFAAGTPQADDMTLVVLRRP